MTLDTLQMTLLMEFFKDCMTMTQRHRLMMELPQVYNAMMGREICIITTEASRAQEEDIHL